MISPAYLKSGDTVGILSTARSIDRTTIASAIEMLRSWGLSVQIGQTIGPIDHQFAGTDELRLQDAQRMLNDPTLSAILCCRGGYGTIRFLDRLDFSQLKKHPKWLVGFSDVTYLHNALQQKVGMESIHATMLSQYDIASQENLSSIKKSLFGEELSYTANPHLLNRLGEASAEIEGGNLSILYSMLGTNSTFEMANKILMLEDLDEYLYHIDRMMIALKRANKLSNLAGLVLGAMTDMNDNDTPFGKTALEIIAEHVADYDYPVGYGFPFGHINDNRALYLGRKVKLSVQETGATLAYL